MIRKYHRGNWLLTIWNEEVVFVKVIPGVFRGKTQKIAYVNGFQI
jgi:hypothetical protein